jgi:hypothetical protein
MKVSKILMPSILVGCSTILVNPVVATEVEASNGQRTIHVANDGVDSVNCGTRRKPCRSITQAIQNATSGDLILVGEGRYGDLNGNGIFGEIGEEVGSGPCFCLVEVNKTLKIRSEKGALRTVIDGAGTGRAVVGITASFVAFGALERGFTVTGSTNAGIAVAADEGVTLVGNVAEANRDGDQSGDGFEITQGRKHRLIGNVSAGNGRGFALFGDQLMVIGNLALTNLAAGFEGEGSRLFLHNNAAYSNLNGFLLAGPDHRLIRNSAVGNRLFGIFVQAAQPGAPATVRFVVERSNIYGNNVDPNSARPNCGVLASGADVTATHNYWGSAEGPGPDPADFACSEPAREIFTRPFSPEEFDVRPSIELSGAADSSS